MWAKFLSNFYPITIVYNGLTFGSVEAAFQAQKCPERAHEFCSLSPRDAKRLGKRVPLRSDWEREKIKIMYSLLCIKFSDPYLQQQLKSTTPHKLEERNTWHDTYWGTDMQGNGKNVLGSLLMVIRDRI